MGLGYAWSQTLKGNFANAFNGLFTSDAAIAAPDESASALETVWRQQQAAGLIDATQANDLYTQLAPNSNSTAYWDSAGPTPLSVFGTTLADEVNTIPNAIQSATNRITGFGFRLIPWQVWIIGFVILLIWLYPLWKPFAVSFLDRE